MYNSVPLPQITTQLATTRAEILLSTVNLVPLVPLVPLAVGSYINSVVSRCRLRCEAYSVIYILSLNRAELIHVIRGIIDA